METSHTVHIPSVPVVYLKDQSLWRSAHHRAYASPGQDPKNPNAPTELLVLEFWGGVARDVERRVYDVFAAAGIATTDRPRFDDTNIYRRIG